MLQFSRANKYECINSSSDDNKNPLIDKLQSLHDKIVYSCVSNWRDYLIEFQDLCVEIYRYKICQSLPSLQESLIYPSKFQQYFAQDKRIVKECDELRELIAKEIDLYQATVQDVTNFNDPDNKVEISNEASGSTSLKINCI